MVNPSGQMIAHGARILVNYGEKSMNFKQNAAPPLILASSSRYRKKLLQTLGLPFIGISPDCDESLTPGESAQASTLRLAQAKAETIAQDNPQACIIGSDQLCCLRSSELIGKPGTLEKATAQLAQLSGQSVLFITAVCVWLHGQTQQHVSTTQVQFRPLSSAEIDRYLQQEPEAIHCAGSFMSEALGISLCSAIHSDDPSALIGLPLIATANMLRQNGYPLP